MTATPGTPTLVFVIGPMAVGKMTIGHEVALRTGFKLFHNHHTIDLALRFFEYGSPPFRRLVSEFRHRILEEVAASDLSGLIFTYVCAFDEPADTAAVERFADIFRSRNGRVVFVELEATQAERLRRSATEFRLAEKPVMRDLDAARARILELDARYHLNSGGIFDGRADYLRIDTTELAPADVAERIIDRFQLPRVSAL